MDKKEEWPRFSFYGLLAILLAFFLIHPFFRATPFGSVITGMLLSAVLLATVYALSEDKTYFRISLALVVPTLALSWWNLHDYSVARQLASYSFNIAFLVLAIAIIGSRIFRSKTVNVNMIIGAICIYTLAAIAWGIAYTAIELVNTGSFSGLTAGRLDPIDRVAENTICLIYYSIVTITTLGYGDIAPIAPLARSLSGIEALFGQFYIATTIATLIGVRTRTQTL